MTKPQTGALQGTATAFYCEHRPSRSRVFALVTVPGRTPVLSQVLTCEDAIVAEAAAHVLSVIADGAVTADAAAALGVIERSVPEAVASGLRAGAKAAASGVWPVSFAPTPGEITAFTRNTADHAPEPMPDRDTATGIEVRIESAWAVRVRDPEALFAAARIAGWSFDEDEDVSGQVVEAVLHLAGNPRTPAGTDLLDHATDAWDTAIELADEADIEDDRSARDLPPRPPSGPIDLRNPQFLPAATSASIRPQ